MHDFDEKLREEQAQLLDLREFPNYVALQFVDAPHLISKQQRQSDRAIPGDSSAILPLFLSKWQSWAAAFVLAALGAVSNGPLAASPPVTERAESVKPLLGVESFEAAWRIINETYFDPTFNGVDWRAVRTELRPKAQAARTVQELRAVIEEMLSRLGASHMALIPGEAADSLSNPESTDISDPTDPSDADPGFDHRLVGREVLVTRVDPEGPAAQAGVKPGWLLVSVDGRKVAEILEPWTADLSSRRSQFMVWRVVTGRLSGGAGTAVDVEFLDGADQVVLLSLTRRTPKGEPAKIGNLPSFRAHFDSSELPLPDGAKVGVIRFDLWMVPIVRALDDQIDKFRNADGIIIDLRGNLGGLGGMILGVSGHFLNERISLGQLKMRGSNLDFFTNPRRVNSAGQRVTPYAGPVAILIDGLSLSASEIFAGGMQAVGRARVFGETSGGQALPAIWDRLPNGDVLYHAFGDFVIASGERVEGQGVRPDERIETKREDLLGGKDAPMLAAVSWIGAQRASQAASKSPGP